MHVTTWFTFVALCLTAVVSGCGGETSSPASAETVTSAAQVGAESKPEANKSAEAAPVVLLRTSLGDITVRLYPEKAPRTVQNFLNYVASGHYDGTIFHDVASGYVALGGSYTPELVEKPVRYPIRNEADNGLKNLRGTIAMARQLDAIDSSTCQFFINLADNPNLDYRGASPEEFGFCVFGQVESGMEVLDKLNNVATSQRSDFERLPVETVMLHSARRIQ